MSTGLATDASMSMNIQSVDSSVTHGVIHHQSPTVPVVLHSASDVIHSAGDVTNPEAFTIVENPEDGEPVSVYDDDGGLGSSALMGTDITGDGSEQILTVAMAPGKSILSS